MLNELYQDIIVDHTKAPRNFGELTHASHQAEGYNPLCGDQIKLFLNIDDQKIIRHVKFTGNGCSISMASASLMSENLIGKTVSEAKDLFESFHKMLTVDQVENPASLEKLLVFSGVKDYPARVKCATLAWHTLEAALDQKAGPLSTE